MAKQSRFTVVVTVLLAVWVIVLALPQSWKMWAPGFIRNPSLHLGLDLVGGTQLDFRISEEEILQELQQVESQIATLEQAGGDTEALMQLRTERDAIIRQQQNLVEAIRTVLERRINALGVSESTITPSFVGNERHLLVECPGVVDIQKCIEVVGKTIQLEFKEEFTEATADFRREIAAKATDAEKRVRAGASLQSVGQDLSSTLGVEYRDSKMLFRDEIPKGLESVWSLEPGTLLRREGTVTAAMQLDDGTTQEKEITGIFLVETLAPLTQTGRLINEAPKAFAYLAKTEEGLSYKAAENVPLAAPILPQIQDVLRTVQPGTLQPVSIDDGSARVLFVRQRIAGREQLQARHILVSYKGAAASPAGVSRTRQEAATRVAELKKQLDGGASFASVARSASDGPSAARGGSLGTLERGTMPPSFDDAAFALQPGMVSDPVETQYGYHLITVDKAASVKPDTVSYDELTVTGTNAMARAGALVEKLKSGQVRSQEQALRMRSLFFSYEPTGWKDTALDGKHFRTAVVSLDPVTNIPVVQITFDTEGGKMFQELTGKNIGKRIAIFVGGELVSAPTVQSEIAGGTAVITGSSSIEEARTLAQDLNTGAIPAPIYLVGQYTVEATLGAAALRTSLLAAFVGTILLMLYMVVVYRGLGVVADLALLCYAAIFFALLKLPVLFVTSNYIVLTLAGMAGIILSIGIAVDANVLVFERLKEELHSGRPFRSAVETSFIHAWPAIRDSNISSIITCVILFMIGTSIVRGFAVTLGLGVVLSLFTAIVVTRWMLRKISTMSISNNLPLFVSMPKQEMTQSTQ